MYVYMKYARGEKSTGSAPRQSGEAWWWPFSVLGDSSLGEPSGWGGWSGMGLSDVRWQPCSTLGFLAGGFCTSSLSSCLAPSAPERPFAMTSWLRKRWVSPAAWWAQAAVRWSALSSNGCLPFASWLGNPCTLGPRTAVQGPKPWDSYSPSYVYPDLGNHIREDTCMQVLNNGDTGNPACQKSEQKQRIWSHEIPSSNNPSLLPIASLPLWAESYSQETGKMEEADGEKRGQEAQRQGEGWWEAGLEAPCPLWFPRGWPDGFGYCIFVFLSTTPAQRWLAKSSCSTASEQAGGHVTVKDTHLASLEPRRLRLPDILLEIPQNSSLPLSSLGESGPWDSRHVSERHARPGRCPYSVNSWISLLLLQKKHLFLWCEALQSCLAGT